MIHFYHDIDAWELYDLEKDGLELQNVYDEPDYAGIRTELQAELKRLRLEFGDSDELSRSLLKRDLEKLELN